MTVTKAVMANGSFSLAISADIPSPVRASVDLSASAFAHLVVLPAPLDPATTTASTLFAKSIYTGVVTNVANGLKLEGMHATAWLGDSTVGDINERTSSPLSLKFSDWMNAVISGQTALHAGNIVNLSPATAMTWDPLKLKPREMFDYIVSYFRSATGNPSIEWQVGDNLLVNAGTTTDLYGANPYAMLTPLYDGPDPVVPGLQASLGFTDDVQDYATRELFYYTGGGVGVNGTTTVWKDGWGNLVARKRTDTDTNVPSGNASSQAAAIIDKYDQARRQLTATSTRPAVMLDLPAGASVYVWDQDKGIYNLSNQVVWRGTVATPDIVRVMGIEMPVEAGMGVYLIKDGSTVTDLTRWFIPEKPGATLTLGALERRYAL